MIELKTVDEFFEFIGENDLAVIDFYAEWCKPCQNFLRISDRVVLALMAENAKIAKVNIETSPDLKTAFQVMSVPTFLYYKDGQLKERHSGIKTIAEMTKIVQHINS